MFAKKTNENGNYLNDVRETLATNFIFVIVQIIEPLTDCIM